jgi:hypothetical protein
MLDIPGLSLKVATRVRIPLGLQRNPSSEAMWFFGIWRGLPAHRTTIEPSTRQFGLPA